MIATILSANAQTINPQLQKPETFRVQVRLVPIDVIVTDAKGKPVTDLKVEDFRIYENGQLQEIRHFALQTRSNTVSESSPQPSNDAAELRSQPGRIFLILMGRGRIQLPFGSVDDIIRFVRDSLLPQDRVAVFAFSRATDFTADHAKIIRVLERYKTAHEKIEALESQRLHGLAAIYGNHAIPKKLQPEIDRIFVGPEESLMRQPTPANVPQKRTMAIEADRATEGLLRKAAAEEAAAAGDPGAALRLSIMGLLQSVWVHFDFSESF